MIFNIKIIFLVTWFFICAFAFSNAGSNVIFFVLVSYFVTAWGIVWLIRLIVSYLNFKRGKISKFNFYGWVAELAIFIMPVLLSYFGVFSHVRFSLSERALSEYVQNVRQGNVDLNFEFYHPVRTVGLYKIAYTDLLSDGTVRVITSSHRLLDKAGFAYSNQSPPPKQGEDSYKNIKDRWWYWYESW